jgi:VanZ family protein
VALWAPVVIYMALIFAGSSASHPPAVGVGIPDKVVHAVVYAGLGALLVRALSLGWIRPVTARIAWQAAIVATLYGASDEFHQALVPGREVEALDLAADAVGAALAAGALWAWGIIRRRDGL